MKQFLASVAVFAMPAIAFGQQPVGGLIRSILNFFSDVVNFAGPFLIAVALLAFFWSLIKFLFESDKTKESKDFLVWSIIILFVMVSIWGIIAFFQSNLGIGDGRDLVNTPRVVVPGI